MKRTKKLIGMIVAVMLVLTGIPLMPSVVRADPVVVNDITYLNPTISTTILQTCATATEVTDSDAHWGNVGDETWYVVNGSDISNSTYRIEVRGTVNLILVNNMKLKVNKGISVTPGNTLRIFGQSENGGELISGVVGNDNVKINTNDAGIGGADGQNCGTIEIYSGNVEAQGGSSSSCIGGGHNGNGGNVTIVGGTVGALRSQYHGAIGKGDGGNSEGNLFLGKVKVEINSTHNYVTANDRRNNCRTTTVMASIDITPCNHNGSSNPDKCDYCGTENVGFEGESSPQDCVPIDNEVTTLPGGWYVVNNDVTNGNRITVKGEVNLILADGKKLTASAGITVADDDQDTTTPSTNILNIYGQSGGTGKLYAGTANGTDTTCDGNNAGIGGSDSGGTSCGTININGGVVEAHGGLYGAGIGGSAGDSGTVYINGGVVKATGGSSGAGIGGGNNGGGANVTINGGIVTATGGSSGAGIGGGNNGSGGNTTINGGYVTATGEGYADGIGKGSGGSDRGALYIGSNVNVYNGGGTLITKTPGSGETMDSISGDDRTQTMKAIKGVRYKVWDETEKTTVEVANPIYNYTPVTPDLTSWNVNNGFYVVNTNVTISDRITATGTVNLILCDGKTLTAPKGITVSGNNSLSIYGQTAGTGALISGVSGTIEDSEAGIGGEFQGAGGTVTIHGGNVTATGGHYAAGIGGGHSGNGGTTTIHGGIVTAIGGEDGAGIGGGRYTHNDEGGNGGTITINGGTVTARSGNENEVSEGAGIGGGSNGNGGTITIKGVNTIVTATGGSSGAGIGGGVTGSGGTIKIYDGTVTATGGLCASGIGIGDRGANAALDVYGGTITATGGDGIYDESVPSNIVEVPGGAGIFCAMDEVSGNASITATGGKGAEDGGEYKTAGGDGVNGKIVVKRDSPTITATGGEGTDGGSGIKLGGYFDSNPTKALIVENGSPAITATGGNATTGDAGFGIYGGATVTGGSPRILATSGVNNMGEFPFCISGLVEPGNLNVLTSTTGNDPWVAYTSELDDGVNAQYVKISTDEPTPVNHTLTFDPNGGSGTMAAQVFTHGVAQALNANAFTRTSYSFTGWNTQTDGGGTAYADREQVTLTTDLTLYAQWKYSPSVGPSEPVYYGTISFNANGGTGTMGSVKAQSGTTITLPANAFTREGYTFTEWNTKADGSGLRYYDKSFVTVTNFTLYAQWKKEEPEPEPNVCTIRYDANGGEGTMQPQTVVRGEEYTVKENAYLREGYRFTRWNTASDGKGTSYAPGAKVTLTEDMTLYAQWKAEDEPDTIRLMPTEADIEVSGTVTFDAEASGEVTWTSSDPTVAIVSDGVVTALKSGTTTITATCGEVSASAQVTVYDKILKVGEEVEYRTEKKMKKIKLSPKGIVACLTYTDQIMIS